MIECFQDGPSAGIMDDDGAGSDHDAYLERVKAEAEEDDGDDDNESSEDEDFAPPTGDMSDIDLEYDSNASSTASEDEDGEAGGEKKKKKEKKKKRESSKPEGGKKKKKKKKEDDGRPKRAPSAYFLWLNENREQIKSKHPGISITELSKKAGEIWREMSPADKKEYETKCEGLRKKYEEEMKVWKASGGASTSGASAPKKPNEAAKKKSTATVTPTKGGSGAGFKSKEYISSDESSDDEAPSSKVAKLLNIKGAPGYRNKCISRNKLCIDNSKNASRNLFSAISEF